MASRRSKSAGPAFSYYHGYVPLTRLEFAPAEGSEWSDISSTSSAPGHYEDVVRSRLRASPRIFTGRALADSEEQYLAMLAQFVEQSVQQCVGPPALRVKLLQPGNQPHPFRCQVDAVTERPGQVADLGEFAELLFGNDKWPAGTVFEITINSAALLHKFRQIERLLMVVEGVEVPHVCIVCNRKKPNVQFDSVLPPFRGLVRLADLSRLTVIYLPCGFNLQETEAFRAEMRAEAAQLRARAESAEAALQELMAQVRLQQGTL